jgi:DNA repair protein RadD
VESRRYQNRAARTVETAWAEGIRSVLLVAPTGSGKTRMGDMLVSSRRTLWVAHRRELVTQALGRLRETRGSSGVGAVMPGEPESPLAPVQCGTVQSLVARGRRFDVDLVVLDEAHHYLAEEWRALVDAYPKAKFLGLTATPERKDGEPLGDIFQRLVVAASYSELLTDGFLVPTRVYQPPKNLGNDLALAPLDAWAKYAEGSRTFVFSQLVATAYSTAQQFRDHGVIAQTIEAETALRERKETLEGFRSGRIRVVTNVYALTEGVDVPEARAVVLARSFGHVGGYLQVVGRVLRPAAGKPDAIVIDLCGATIRHGLPTQDRIYSLSGRAISTREFVSGGGPGDREVQQVKGVGLRLVTAPPVATTTVDLAPIGESERKAEFLRLLALARAHRMRDGFASVKYREKYGEEPRREWRT